MQSDVNAQLLEAALSYARRGWYVFPVKQPILGDDKSGKAPVGTLVHNGKDDATTDESTIRWWWSQGDWNIGINTQRSRLVVLDVDISKGKRGRESLAKINSQLHDTLTAQTGSGGIHAFYEPPADFIPSQKIGFDDGLDLISNGYVLAAPSRHYTGGVYSWINSSSITQLPEVLRHVQRTAKQLVTSAEVGMPIPEGGRNNALFKLGAALRSTGITHDALLAALVMENEKRFVPPLGDQEVAQVAASVMRKVKVERDVAAGTVVQEQLQAMFGGELPEPVALHIRDVAQRPKKPMRFYSTGNAQLDALIGGGLATSHVCGVIGPPSVGKSAFVSSVSMHLQMQLPVLHVSTELTRYELMIRDAANRRGFPWRDGMKGKHDDELMQAIDGLNITLIGCDNLDRTDPIGSIVNEACAIKEAQGTSPAIIIDYVQLLARGNEEGMRARVGELTMKIRMLAQLLDCPIIAVFSTGRGYYGGGKLEQLRQMNDPTAYLGAAKESGDIEFDCATLLFLDVDQLAEGTPKPARAVVARCRVGDIGEAGYRADLAVGRWIPDPFAPAEMKSEEKSKKKAADEQSKEDQAVIDVIERFPGIPWGRLRDDYLRGIVGHQKAEAAKTRLMQNRRIESIVEYDESARKRWVLKVVKGKPNEQV